MTLYGILMSLAAVLGGFAGGRLDQWLGPRRAILLEVAMTAGGILALVSIDREHVFFVPVSAAPVWAVPWFDTVPELTLLAVVSVLAVFITAAYASSRTMMAGLAPPEQSGEIFGLYALAGAATAWLGPMLVAAVTRFTNSQQVGFGSLVVLLVIGFLLMLRVKGGGRP
jgi:UMF1 family MFS transporter